jgi:hypothetical protein
MVSLFVEKMSPSILEHKMDELLRPLLRVSLMVQELAP